MNLVDTLVTAITQQFGSLVTQVTQVFTDNLPSIMTVIGLSVCLTIGIKLVKKMKGI